MNVEFLKEKRLVIEEGEPTLLQVALQNGIPHEHACGGNGLCSTCRVLVLEGEHNLAPKNETEQQLSAKKGFESRVRLACQAKVRGDVQVKRLVLDKDDLNLAIQQNVQSTGKQQKVAVLFSDIRQFTPFVQSHLAYDVVHILNRYFYQMGQAVLRHNGMIDKYIGDGMMALFGVDSSCPMQTCLDAVAAALDMLKELEVLNRYLQSHFEHRMEIGIGIDFGEVLLGDLGHPDKKSLTAVGNTVNVASRIESATKDFSTALLVSDSVYQQVKHLTICQQKVQTLLKGTSSEHKLYAISGFTEQTRSDDVYLRHFELLQQHINRADAPSLLRLAFHDAMTFDPVSGGGGCNGSLLLTDELLRPENSGLEAASEFIQRMKAQMPELSYADLIALAAVVAVRICDGPQIRIAMGRSDSTVASTLPLPQRFDTIDTLLQRFESVGLSARDMVALFGAHSLGKSEAGTFTPDPFKFDNSYYVSLLRNQQQNKEQQNKEQQNKVNTGQNLCQRDGMLPSDIALLQLPELRKWVIQYAADQQMFFGDFSNALQKMLNLGGNFS